MRFDFLTSEQDRNRFAWIPAFAEMTILAFCHLRGSGNLLMEPELEIIPVICPAREIQGIEAVLAVQFAHVLAWEIFIVSYRPWRLGLP